MMSDESRPLARPPRTGAGRNLPERRASLDPETAWAGLLAIRRWTERRPAAEPGAGELLSIVDRPEAGGVEVVGGRVPDALFWSLADGGWESPAPAQRRAASILDLYMPACRATGRSTGRMAGGGAARSGAARGGAAVRPYVIAHLGQTLDGRIATVSGSSQWVTGPADLVHTHRMRALADAVAVGAGTVRADDPQLTVRRVAGRNPLRVVIDSNRRLSRDYRLFRDGAAPTLLVCGAAAPGTDAALPEGAAPGGTTLVTLPRQGDAIAPADICAMLAARGVRLLFLEGGGVTISRFLQAGCIDRLQLTVAPVLLGSGRPAISLPEVTEIGEGLRPRVRHFVFDDDVMFECIFDGRG